MASSSTGFTLKDAGFFVKNVPLDFEDWDLFSAFSVHGLVGYCRIGGTSQDKVSQFGFVNMLTVEAADKVRENLKNGHLQWKGHSIQVNDVKSGNLQTSPSRHNGYQYNPNQQQKTTNLYGPIQLPFKWLPIREQVTIEVVDYLPCSSINESVFALTVRMNDDKVFDASYESMNEKLAQFNQLCKFEKELQIGFDCLYKENPKGGHRARRISPSELYLVDEGVTVPYDKLKCFQLPKQFANLPMRVSLCSVDGLRWSRAAIPTFSRIREVIKKWGEVEGDNLKAMNLGFNGALNMINIYSGNSCLAQRLTRPGICEFIPRAILPQFFYNRDDLMSMKLDEYPPKIEKLEQEVLKDLIKDFSNSSISN